MKIYPQILTLVAACVMAGCTNDETLATAEEAEARPISFSVETEAATNQTRATTAFTGTSFMVMADYSSDGGTTWTEYIPKQTVTKSGDVWKTATDYYMPKTGKIRFYAWASKQYGDASRSLPGLYPIMDVDNVSLYQDDLLTATVDAEGGSSENIILTFSHALASLWYSVTSNSTEGTVSNVNISNVLEAATYYFDGRWDKLTSNRLYSIGNTRNSARLVIPQNLSGKTLSLWFTSKGSSMPQTLTTTISNVSLSPGNCYELKLTISKYEIAITVSITGWTGETYDTKTLYI